MELGKVVGQVVSTVRDESVPHATLLLVDLVDIDGKVLRGGQIATDTLGAGEGEMVMLVRGSSASQTFANKPPIDLSIVGIIDQVTGAGKLLYNK